jgi:crotonobetainyl-CoA:carnitine CoA-transferase CaiB-like acyl-CoA transferase
MIELRLPHGGTTLIPALPLELDGKRLGRRFDIPRIGEHSAEIAEALGLESSYIDDLIRDRILGEDPGKDL